MTPDIVANNSMQTPTVSFIVPCYKLGHLLSECVGAILAQTYADFEVLIMDDCSPDSTPEVAKTFQDSRVKHIRNERNLGLIDNFNKGIGLSRGKYVWIISADDYLLRPDVLKRYVELMERHSSVGYTFCPAIVGEKGQEIVDFSYGKCDRIVRGHVFLKSPFRLIAASVMIRRECYESISLFPKNLVWAGEKLDMTWAGDWYLWCLFALWFDVGYFAEPMVYYRRHDLSITSAITQQESIERCIAEDIAVPWLIRQKAAECGLRKVAKYCLRTISREYAAHLLSTKGYRSSRSSMTVDQFEASLCRSTNNQRERNWIRARVSETMGDKFFWGGDPVAARTSYLHGLQTDWRMPTVYSKLLLLLIGAPGNYIRKLVLASRGT